MIQCLWMEEEANAGNLFQSEQELMATRNMMPSSGFEPPARRALHQPS